MTLQEFKDRALEIFPGANVGGVTKDRHEPNAPLLMGLIEIQDSEISFKQIAHLTRSVSTNIKISSQLHSAHGDGTYIDITSSLRIRVTL
jgi:hypothetical protein